MKKVYGLGFIVYRFIFLLLASCLSASLLLSCGSEGLYTNNGQQAPLPSAGESKNLCSAENPCSVSITKNAFIFGGDFPSDIVIPDIEGMSGTAFVVTASNPSGVIALDLDTNPISVSTKYAGLIAPSGTGYPGSLFIMSATRAFLVTSSHVIDFNPVTGAVNKSQALSYKITLTTPRPLSDNSANVTTISTSYPASAAVADSKLYITTSNYINPLTPALAAPGTVLVFDILDSEPFIKARTFIPTTDYNPTGITPLPDGTLAVTNSGVSDLIDAHSEPKTNASLDIIAPAKNQIVANIPLGTVGLSFQEMAVTKDGVRGFIGSISYGEMYEIDLANRAVIHDHSSPVTITGNVVGSDYLSAQALSQDDEYLFVSSFENSAIYPVKIEDGGALTLPGHFTSEPFAIGFSDGVTAENPSGTNTGAGPIAIRPNSADVFVLTGYPGTLAAINTRYKGDKQLLPAPKPEPEPEPNPETAAAPKEEPPPSPPPPEDKTCQGFATAVVEVEISKGGGLNYKKLPDVVLGPPEPLEGNTTGTTGGSIGGVVSLGIGGSIILDMGECEIVDGTGKDFIVFENAFFITNDKTPASSLPQKAINDPASVNVFAEPGTVSVSEDGTLFHSFPCDPNIPITTALGTISFYNGLQSGCAGITPTLDKGDIFIPGLENGSGGDAFDLSDIGINRARYVKITSAGTYKKPADPDNPGNGSGGFDLDAIIVINGEK